MNYPTEDEAIAAAKAAALASGDLVEFEGQNCNDYPSEDSSYCGGWDGEDRRCDCGNRRVSWAAYGDDKNGYFAVAQAY